MFFSLVNIVDKYIFPIQHLFCVKNDFFNFLKLLGFASCGAANRQSPSVGEMVKRSTCNDVA